MITMSYESGVGARTIDLGTPASCGDPSGLRSRQWTYELGYRNVSDLRYAARELSFSFTGTYQNADALRGCADADAAARKPGTIEVDGWRQRAYIVGQTPEIYQHGRIISAIDVLLLDGFWWREKTKHFVSGLSDSGIDHPYDFNYDLSFSAGRGSIEVETALGAKPCITFYGPCTNPYIALSGLVDGAQWANRYEVDAQALSTQKIVVDARSDTPTAKLIDNQGNASSVFAHAVRDGGRGGGSYAFEQIPHGAFEVAWSGSFAFDIAWRELETEPIWSR